VAGWPSWLANLAEVFTEKDYRLLMHGYDIPLGCEFRPEDAQGRNAEPIVGVANKTCRRGERPLFRPPSTLISIHARCQLLANALTVKGEAVEGSGK